MEKKLTIYNIKPKQEFYDVNGYNIIEYEYLCLMPAKNPVNEGVDKYHIIINKTTEEPVRIWSTRLSAILNKNILSYDDATLIVKQNLQDRLDKFDKYH